MVQLTVLLCLGPQSTLAAVESGRWIEGSDQGNQDEARGLGFL